MLCCFGNESRGASLEFECMSVFYVYVLVEGVNSIYVYASKVIPVLRSVWFAIVLKVFCSLNFSIA